jgi:hypothetical protein
VGLHTDTVDWDAGGLEGLDDGNGTVDFWSGGFEVVVIVEKFRVGVGGMGSFECNVNCGLKVR